MRWRASRSNSRNARSRKLVTDQGANRFDRHQHDALPEGRTDQPVARVKADGGLVYRVGNDPPRSDDFGCSKAPPQSIGQERRSQTSAPPLRIDCEASNQQERHLLGHAAAKLS
jgi:hypothetical protein